MNINFLNIHLKKYKNKLSRINISLKTLVTTKIFTFYVFFFTSNTGVAQYQHTFDSIATKVEKIYYSHSNEASRLIDQLYLIAKQSNDSSLLITRSLSYETSLSYIQGRTDNSITSKIKSRLERSPLSPSEHALLLYSLGMNFSTTGDYSSAFTTSLEALEEFKVLNDSNYVAKTLNLLGNICSHINLLTMSKDYYAEALAWTAKDNPEYYRIKNNIYRLILFNENKESTIDSLENLVEIIKKEGDSALLTSLYLNLGAVHIANNQMDTAYNYWMDAQELLDSLDNPRMTATLYQNLGTYYVFSKNDYRKALEYFRGTKRISEEIGDIAHLSSAYKIMAKTFDLQGKQDSAYFYLSKHQELSQKLLPNPKAIEAYRAYISTFLEASENKLIIAEQKIKLRHRQFIVAVVIGASLILLSLSSLFIVRQQKRLKENENKDLEKRLEHERKIQQLQKEKQEEVIAANTREVTSYSLLLSNKNHILKQIKDLNTQLSNNPKIANEITKKIERIIKNNFEVDEEWKDFKMHFDKVHPSFFDKLKKHCNDLTENNLKICAYFRIGMSNKQIAQILYISPASVIIHRHRLKKKLGLVEEENLDDFIRNI